MHAQRSSDLIDRYIRSKPPPVSKQPIATAAVAALPAALALVLLAAGDRAAAQSSVTVFGVIDTAVQHIRGAGHGSQWRMHSGGYRSSRLGFRGTEDLGGGLGAGFWIEAGFNSDTGTGAITSINNQPGGNVGSGGLLFNRRSTLSLLSPYGELRAGRDYSPNHLTHAYYDAFGATGLAAGNRMTQALAGDLLVPKPVTEIRVSNSLGYLLPPDLGGWYGQLMVGLGENPSTAVNKRDGDFAGWRLGFTQGAFDISAAYGRTRLQRHGDHSDIGMGASYDFGSFKLMGLVASERAGGPADIAGFPPGGRVRHESVNIGTHVPIGSGQVRASYIRARAKAPNHSDLANGRMASIGYVHFLSKRTQLYGTYSHISNGGAALSYRYNHGLQAGHRGGSTSGIDVGVSHGF